MRAMLVSSTGVCAVVCAAMYVGDSDAFAGGCTPSECALDDIPAVLEADFDREFEYDEGLWRWCLPNGSTPTHGAAFATTLVEIEDENITVTPSFFNPADPEGDIPVTIQGQHNDDPGEQPAFQLEAFVWPPLCEDEVIVEIDVFQ